MKLPDSELTPAQLREIHDVYGVPVYDMAIRVAAMRNVLRRAERDPNETDFQRHKAREMLREVIAEGETHRLLRRSGDDVWLIPPKYETRAAPQPSPLPARAPAEPSIERETLMALVGACAEALAGLREARSRATPDSETFDAVVVRAAMFASDQAAQRAAQGLGSLSIEYGPDNRPTKVIKSDGSVLLLVYDKVGRLSRLERAPSRLDA